MVCREWRQGDLFGNPKREPGNWKPDVIPTQDGSITFWNAEYREHYHTPAGARMEAVEKYIVPGKLEERLDRGDVALLDVCFGLGYNSLAAMDRAVTCMRQKAKGISELRVTALEMDRRIVRAASQSIEVLKTDSFDWKKALADLHQNASCRLTHALCMLHWGDARYTITQLQPGSFDMVFLDPFSTQRNSQLWTVDFFRKLKAVMKPDAVLLTYCAALPVRSGLMEAGFLIGETVPAGRERSGTIAAMRQEDIETPIPDEELRSIRETTRGLPYRDPHGVWTNKEILRDRQQRILSAKASLQA
jgi:tRNA U34 5-methylaminomethyl-2-thiouridine-forming methyltransferase MnmC